MRVASIQTPAFDLSQYKEALHYMLAKIDEAASLDPKLIVVPECAYPSYYLGSSEVHLHEAMNLVEDVIDSIKYKAIKYKTYIAFGLVVKENNKLFNRGILLDPSGNQVGHVNKSFMWHFDSDWFSTEESANIVETPYGKWGLIICADGRMPEIVRNLALQGVDLVIDLANLTSTGQIKEQLTNAQSNFMLSTRALENNVWLVMADKIGIEARTVTYSGRSSIIGPTGEIIAEASPHQEEIIHADIDVTNRPGKLPLRKPTTYQALTEKIETLPCSQIYNEEVIPSNLVIQGSTVQFFYGNKAEYMKQAEFFIQTLEKQLTDVIVLPHSTEEIQPSTIQAAINMDETIVFFSTTEKQTLTLYAVTRKSLTKYDKIHVTDEELLHYHPGQNYKVFETSKGNIGVMIGEDGLFPEVARILSLHGADCIVWINEMDPINQEKVARTRAAENKVFVLTASQLNCCENTSSMIIDPNGNIIAATLKNTEQACSTQMPLVLSRCKNIVPKTNAIFHRTPEKYHRLLN
ncbi:carbon-nitrogen hydrolase family protein [Bacillus suaedaesalsae]|uniref:Carbon-nitrogen hydrolase family protein n=1 Tax=Bacillus suaedaesalsae TaxID=2810349 RepID=A0ABS2DHD5_9BACI|nr:carbon-nitrogen hydrolase family protein [Bacillus suaedaesalsae]MBM6617884.1 carbon-nitrogen hydrolase family protein [Bacillus suaedaesalsae]